MIHASANRERREALKPNLQRHADEVLLEHRSQVTLGDVEQPAANSLLDRRAAAYSALLGTCLVNDFPFVFIEQRAGNPGEYLGVDERIFQREAAAFDLDLYHVQGVVIERMWSCNHEHPNMVLGGFTPNSG